MNESVTYKCEELVVAGLIREDENLHILRQLSSWHAI